MQPVEVCREVEIPQERRLLPRQFELHQSLPCLAEYATGAPGHGLKESGMRSAQPDEHVSPVLGGQKDHIAPTTENAGRASQRRQ